MNPEMNAERLAQLGSQVLKQYDDLRKEALFMLRNKSVRRVYEACLASHLCWITEHLELLPKNKACRVLEHCIQEKGEFSPPIPQAFLQYKPHEIKNISRALGINNPSEQECAQAFSEAINLFQQTLSCMPMEYKHVKRELVRNAARNGQLFESQFALN